MAVNPFSVALNRKVSCTSRILYTDREIRNTPLIIPIKQKLIHHVRRYKLQKTWIVNRRETTGLHKKKREHFSLNAVTL